MSVTNFLSVVRQNPEQPGFNEHWILTRKLSVQAKAILQTIVKAAHVWKDGKIELEFR